MHEHRRRKQGGLGSMKVYKSPIFFQKGYGARRVHGCGLGSIFKSIFRVVKPLAKSLFSSSNIKKVATRAGKELLSSGAAIASDMISGVPASEAFQNEVSVAKNRLAREIKEKVRDFRSNSIDDVEGRKVRVYGPVKRKRVTLNMKKRKRMRDIFT